MISVSAVKLVPEKYGAFRKHLNPLIPSEVSSRLDSYRDGSAANQRLFSYLLSVVMVHRMTGLSGHDIRIFRDSRDKPFAGIPSVYFNLSHSGEWLAGASGNAEVGIDIEKLRDAGSGVAGRFFSAEEIALLDRFEGEDRRLEFFRIWTLKESYIKCLGTGLSHPLDSFSVPPFTRETAEMDHFFFRSYSVCDGYVCSVCSSDIGLPEQIEITGSDAIADLYASLF